MSQQSETSGRSAYANTVVVGVDGSPEAIVAARYAVWQAGLRHLDVLLVYSYPLPSIDLPVSGQFIDGFTEAGRTVLDDALAALDVPPGVEVRTELAETLPALLMQRLSLTAPLLVLGQHPATWYDRMGRGSVASPLAHHAGCPVVVVPPTWRQDHDGPRPVVVPLDGEVAASATLEFAFDEAELIGSEVVALHAVPDGTPEETESARRNLAELLAGVRAEHPDTTARIVTTQGETQQVVLTMARSAGVLVVGPPHTRGLATWTRSLARRVMTEVECPMVVVPRQWHRPRTSALLRPGALVAS